jgi:hypothetical protein
MSGTISNERDVVAAIQYAQEITELTFHSLHHDFNSFHFLTQLHKLTTITMLSTVGAFQRLVNHVPPHLINLSFTYLQCENYELDDDEKASSMKKTLSDLSGRCGESLKRFAIHQVKLPMNLFSAICDMFHNYTV